MDELCNAKGKPKKIRDIKLTFFYPEERPLKRRLIRDPSNLRHGVGYKRKEIGKTEAASYKPSGLPWPPRPPCVCVKPTILGLGGQVEPWQTTYDEDYQPFHDYDYTEAYKQAEIIRYNNLIQGVDGTPIHEWFKRGYWPEEWENNFRTLYDIYYNRACPALVFGSKRGQDLLLKFGSTNYGLKEEMQQIWDEEKRALTKSNSLYQDTYNEKPLPKRTPKPKRKDPAEEYFKKIKKSVNKMYPSLGTCLCRTESSEEEDDELKYRIPLNIVPEL